MKNLTRTILVFVCLFLSAFKDSRAANFYWVGGTGSWSDFANHWATTSGGSTFHTGIPTLNDNVYFDATSFSAIGQSVQMDSTFYFCNNMSWAGVQFNPSLEGVGSILKVYGSLDFNSNMSVNQTSISFNSAQTGTTIDTKGFELSSAVFAGSGSFSLLSPLNCYGNLEINAGTVDANGNNIRCNTLTEAIGATLVSGDIRIIIYGQFFSTNSRKVEALGTIINSDQTTLYFDCESGEVNTTNQTTPFDSIIFVGAGALRQVDSKYASFAEMSFAEMSTVQYANFAKEAWLTTCTFDTLVGTSLKLASGTTTTVNYILTLISDCNNLGTFSSTYPGGVATLNVPAGTITLNYVQLSGITASGGATFNANNSIDNGGNTGWNITSITPRKLYWIGGTGNWNDPAHWSLTSGGSATTCSPSVVDSTIFDANSLVTGDTVYINSLVSTAANLEISGLPVGCTFSGPYFTVNGSVTISSNVNWNINTIRLSSSSTLCTLSSVTPLMYVEMLGTGTYTVTTDLSMLILYITNGAMDFTNRNIIARGVNSYPLTTAIMGNSHWTLQSFSFLGNNINSASATLTFDQPTSHMYSSGTYKLIEFLEDGSLDSNVTATNLICEGAVYLGNNNLFTHILVKNDFYVHGNNETDTLVFDNSGNSFVQDQAATFTVNNLLTANANCNRMISFRSNTPGMQTNIVCSAPSVNISYADISDINASGTTFNASNSINSGNNTGWNISAPSARTLYWVGGAGNWSDSSHWSSTSGGTGGNCVPTAVDDVYMDANSGLVGAILTVDITTAGVNLLDMSDAGAFTLEGSQITAFASVYFSPGMTVTINDLNMRSATTAELVSAGNYLSQIDLGGSGAYSIADELSCMSINVSNGSFDLNGNSISTSNFSSSATSTVNLGNVTLNLTNFRLDGTVTNSTNTNLNFRLFAPVYYAYGYNFRTAGTFNNVIVFDAGISFGNVSYKLRTLTAYGYIGLSSTLANDTIGKAVFLGDVYLSGSLYYDTLFFNNPGHTVNMTGFQTIGSELISGGTPGFPVFIDGTNTAEIIKASGDVCIKNTLLEGITATGGANFFAGQGCTDLGSNSGWQFTSCTTVSDVWPGDANYDLVCDNLDILNIGVAFNQAGPVRAGGNNSWTAQPAADFSNWFSSALNVKHADCDGNGIVEYGDTIAVNQNYTLNHPARYSNPNITSTSTVLPPLELNATPDTVGPQMAVQVEVLLGSSSLPVDSLYGIAYSINYDPTVIDTTSLQENFAGSWLGTVGTDMIAFVHHFPTIGKIDVAMVRNDQQNIFNGFGHLANFDVVIVDNISTVTNSLFRLTDVSAITYSQYVQPLARVNDTIYVDPTIDRVQDADLSDHFSVYPNPATAFVNIHSTDIKVEAYRLFDVTGKLMMQDKTSANQIMIQVESLTQGVYQLQIVTDKGTYNKPIQVINKK